jgi:hypothetical protein
VPRHVARLITWLVVPLVVDYFASRSSALDRLESFREVADGEIVSETPASFAALPVTLTSSVPVSGGLVSRCVSRQLV